MKRTPFDTLDECDQSGPTSKYPVLLDNTALHWTSLIITYQDCIKIDKKAIFLLQSFEEFSYIDSFEFRY
jgi:hypothetical protein